MNQKNLILLGAVTAVIAVLALVVTFSSNDRQAAGPVNQGHVVPGLLDNLNEATRLVISTRNDSITLKRDGETWVVEERHDYPARLENVRSLLLQVANLEKQEPRTSNPDLYTRIEVEDIDHPESRSRLVEIYGEGDRKLAGVIIGATRPATGLSTRSSSFIRLEGDAQSWLASGTVNINTSTSHWVDAQFVTIPSNRVQRVEIEHRDGEVVVVNKPDPNQTNFDLETLPEGRELTSPTRPNELGGLMASLRFDDVMPAAQFDQSQHPVVKVTLDEKDGHRVLATAWESAGQTWFRFESMVNEEKINAINEERLREAGEAAGDEELTPPVADLIDIDAIREKSTEHATRFDGWLFRLPGFSRDRFLRRNDYYLKPLDSETPAVGPDDEEWVTDPVLRPDAPGFEGMEEMDPETMERLQQALEEMMREDPADSLPSEIQELFGEEGETPQVPPAIEDADLLP